MRKGEVERVTLETTIRLICCLDGAGRAELRTGIGFLEHMLQLMALHGSVDLNIEAKGDLQVDCHHLTEDLGICLGQALRHALGDRSGISRYGMSLIPMDEALVMAVLDAGGRPYLHWEVPLPAQQIGDFDTELVEEFMRALANNAGFTLHIKLIHGRNTHHIIEATFKALGNALRQAVSPMGLAGQVLSTKGVL